MMLNYYGEGDADRMMIVKEVSVPWILLDYGVDGENNADSNSNNDCEGIFLPLDIARRQTTSTPQTLDLGEEASSLSLLCRAARCSTSRGKLRGIEIRSLRRGWGRCQRTQPACSTWHKYSLGY